MVELRTEEDQITALKNWWLKYGNTLLIAMSVGLIGMLGWNYYQSEQEAKYQQASAYYDRLLESASLPALEEVHVANIKQDAYTLKTEYDDTVYAHYAALILAKIAVNQADFVQAKEELSWVLSRVEAGSELASLVNIRMASVLAGMGTQDQALALLSDKDDFWQGLRMEVKGDVLATQGKSVEAREAYEQAIEVYESQDLGVALLELKLANLTVR